MKLSRELWLQVEPLLTTALDMEPTARTAWLEGLDATHPATAPVLRRMLASHDRAERSGELETVPGLAPLLNSSAFVAGDRVGPFRLLRPIGRGGMGEVWLAEQADGRVVRQVALKLPTSLEASEIRAERFQRERDILAKLEHPNISRLYDAGVSESGQPYLAMEFVEGLSLSGHVATRSFSIAARLALFRQVLAAVAHAHRHLVVHRDLKPANVLIDASGQVKLLDFGIAKLVDATQGADASGELTRIGGRVMTLRYAAPEQVAAGMVTTATDIYSLGVILHELVTGLAPYRAVREGKALTDAMLLREETTLPSRLALTAAGARACGLSSSKQLARLVSGDLDAIILKAMRRDPADRYASVELLDEDILAHLEKRPVKARAGTWRYLAGRFAIRHTLPLALAAAVLVTMAVGLVMAERERRVAVAQKARAERHFASVRKLANSFIFDVHREIENLAGSLKAREMLVKTSLEYLDALAGEAGGDPALMYELAVAYRNIGNVQGQPGAANKGDLAAAIGNFEKATDLFVALERMKPDDVATLREHHKLSYALARSYFLTGNPKWQNEIAETARIAERIAALPGATASDRAFVASTVSEKAHLTSLIYGRNPDVDAAIARSIEMLEALVREAPGQVDLREALGSAYGRAARMLAHIGRTAQSVREAVEHARKAREITRQLAAEFPDDAGKRARKLEGNSLLAATLVIAGEYREADRTMEEGLAISRGLVAQYPKDVSGISDHIAVLHVAAQIAVRLGDNPRAIRLGREALAIPARLPKETLSSRDVRGDLAGVRAYTALALMGTAADVSLGRAERLARLREARSLLADCVAYVAQDRAENLGDIPEDDERELMAAVKRCDEAIARLEAA